MSSYLVVKNTNNDSCSYLCKDTHTSVPYLKVDTGYLDLTTETTTGTYLVVKNSDSTYRPKKVSIINTTTEGTVTEGYSCSGQYDVYIYLSCTGDSTTITKGGLSTYNTSSYVTMTNTLDSISALFISSETLPVVAYRGSTALSFGPVTSTKSSRNGMSTKYSLFGAITETSGDPSYYSYGIAYVTRYSSFSQYNKTAYASLTFTRKNGSTAWYYGNGGSLSTDPLPQTISLSIDKSIAFTVNTVINSYTVYQNTNASAYVISSITGSVRHSNLVQDTITRMTMESTNASYISNSYTTLQTTWGNLLYYTHSIRNSTYTSSESIREYYTITNQVPITSTAEVNTSYTTEV